MAENGNAVADSDGRPAGDPRLTREMLQEAARRFAEYRSPEEWSGAPSAGADKDETEDGARCLRLDIFGTRLRTLTFLTPSHEHYPMLHTGFTHSAILDLQDLAELNEKQGSEDSPTSLPRPADLWGGDHWLTPSDPVGLDDYPAPGPFSPLQDDVWQSFDDYRRGERGFVLAAVERAVTGGQPLVIVGLPAEVAIWTSLVTHLMVPSVAWSFTFSTYQKVLDGRTVPPNGPRVIGVPPSATAGVTAIPGSKISILESGSPPIRTAAGYRLHDGTILPIGNWARLAEMLCAAGLQDELRSAVDAVGRNVGPSTDNNPLWGLGAAVVQLADHPDGPVDLPDGVGELAAQILEGAAPVIRSAPSETAPAEPGASGNSRPAPVLTDPTTPAAPVAPSLTRPTWIDDIPSAPMHDVGTRSPTYEPDRREAAQLEELCMGSPPPGTAAAEEFTNRLAKWILIRSAHHLDFGVPRRPVPGWVRMIARPAVADSLAAALPLVAVAMVQDVADAADAEVATLISANWVARAALMDCPWSGGRGLGIDPGRSFLRDPDWLWINADILEFLKVDAGSAAYRVWRERCRQFTEAAVEVALPLGSPHVAERPACLAALDNYVDNLFSEAEQYRAHRR